MKAILRIDDAPKGFKVVDRCVVGNFFADAGRAKEKDKDSVEQEYVVLHVIVM